MVTVRIAVCGDEGCGKSSLITSLVKDTFVSSKIQAVLPQITIPPTLGTPENVTTVIVDTSALPQERPALAKEIRKSNVILLVYSDHYSYERVALFWMPYFRSLGVNLPVVLCANKKDLVQSTTSKQVVDEEMLPVMSEWKEIDSCIRTSAREHYNVNEAFFLCQKAVTCPVAPLFDAKESQLKPGCVDALRRIFYLCDKDKDGFLNDDEIRGFQMKCFEKELHDDDLSYIKDTVETMMPDEDMSAGISPNGFLLLNRLYAEKGRHETIWIILRSFQYTDSLSLQESYLHPKFDVPEFASAELSPAGYRFFVDLFLTSDRDTDGGLNEHELTTLFAPTPGIPQSWLEDGFPSCTVRNEAGHVTLQGWLAQWSMTTFMSPKTTLEYLAFLGFESTDHTTTTTAALKLTKPRKRRSRHKSPRVQRNVLFAHVVGAPHSGKSSLLDTFLSSATPTSANKPLLTTTYHPTIHPRVVVNTVELPGGKQVYLILSELGESESIALENRAKLLSQCDLLVYVYDSSDPDSFAYIPRLRGQHPHLEDLPSMYVALKADLDRNTQRSEIQPDVYVAETLRMPQGPAVHTSVVWPGISDVFVQIAERGLEPGSAFPRVSGDEGLMDGKLMQYGLAFGAFVAAAGSAVYIWRRAMGDQV